MKDQYLSYSAVELAQDAHFIAWVRGQDEAVAQQWEDWLQEQPEMAEVVATARRLAVTVLAQEKPPPRATVERIWQGIDAATVATERRPLRIARRLAYAAAAAIALALTFFFLWPGTEESLITLRVPKGAILEHQLPGGSRVWANAASSITYQAAGWAESRQVSLEGEAYFEVEKGSPFTVATSVGTVTVLGTRFNANTYDGHFSVQCYSGQVQTSVGTSSILLGPAEAAEWAGGRWEKQPLETGPEAAWRNGLFRFRNAPLQLAFASLERQFDVRVEAPDSVRQRLYTGFFEKNDLDSALYRICWPMQLEAEQEGKTIRIRSATKE